MQPRASVFELGFVRNADGSATCMIHSCGQRYSETTSTGTMLEHIRKKHKHLSTVQEEPLSPELKKELDGLVADYIAASGHSFWYST